MKLLLGFGIVALVFLLSVPSIEGARKKDGPTGDRTYCENSDISGNCLSGWITPPPTGAFKAPQYHQCSVWEGDGCVSGYRN